MNILIIPTNDWLRSPGHGHIDYIGEKLAERGHNVYVWYFDLCRNEQVKRTPKNVKLIRSRTLFLRDTAAFFSINALVQGPAMLKRMRELRIDVVINENIFSGLVAFLVSNRFMLKVFDYSDYFPESASIYYEKGFKAARIAKKLVETITLVITKLNIKNADVCLSVCYSLMNDVHRTDSKKPCYLLHNTADLSKHRHLIGRHIPSKDDNSGPVIVIMGVIDNWLDLITPLKGIRILVQSFPKIKIIIIGPWRNAEFRTYIDSFVESEQLASHVEITGYVPDQQLAEYLNSANLCVMPYRTDNFSSIIRLPEKLFVYSAYGKPILSSPLPEVKLLKLEHVFFYHTVDEFVKIALATLNEKGNGSRLSAKALNFAQEYDVNVLANRLEQILLQNMPKNR